MTQRSGDGNTGKKNNWGGALPDEWRTYWKYAHLPEDQVPRCGHCGAIGETIRTDGKDYCRKCTDKYLALKKKDEELAKQIERLNAFARRLNESTSKYSPPATADGGVTTNENEFTRLTREEVKEILRNAVARVENNNPSLPVEEEIPNLPDDRDTRDDFSPMIVGAETSPRQCDSCSIVQQRPRQLIRYGGMLMCLNCINELRDRELMSMRNQAVRPRQQEEQEQKQNRKFYYNDLAPIAILLIVVSITAIITIGIVWALSGQEENHILGYLALTFLIVTICSYVIYVATATTWQ